MSRLAAALSLGIVLTGTTLPLCAQQSAARPSLLDQAPNPPVIRYAAGLLTIEATNSSLRTILDGLQLQAGTKVQGLGHDERIFGTYGPGKPQEVLSSLLDSSGYNVLISGQTASGAPREILLSTRSVPTGASSQSPTQAAQEDDDEGAAESAPVPQPALFTPPPQQQLRQQQSIGQSTPFGQQNQPGQDGQPSSGNQPVKTPQQLLEELQRLRQTSLQGQNSGQTQ